MIRIMIADDQELIRESLKVVLDMNPDMEVIGLAENGRQLLEILAGNVPDVILMDVRMPELDGVLCTKAVKEKYPQAKIIILTTFDDDEYVY
ncbi:MAG: response regulator transcription factor, partial [Selenomonadaceae bacterium]|nr:response regulator transcription factor [Selenomonadaceae bacterium]